MTNEWDSGPTMLLLEEEKTEKKKKNISSEDLR